MMTFEIMLFFAVLLLFGYTIYIIRELQSVPADIYSQLPKLLADGKVVGVDVRSASEIAQNPSYKSIKIPLADLNSKSKELKKDKIYIIFCESGGRASLAIGLLKRAGLESVYSVGTWRKWNKVVYANNKKCNRPMTTLH